MSYCRFSPNRTQNSLDQVLFFGWQKKLTKKTFMIYIPILLSCLFHSRTVVSESRRKLCHTWGFKAQKRKYFWMLVLENPLILLGEQTHPNYWNPKLTTLPFFLIIWSALMIRNFFFHTQIKQMNTLKTDSERTLGNTAVPRRTLTQYVRVLLESTLIRYVWKLFLLDKNTWNHITVYKQMIIIRYNS